jgi:cytochrome c
MKKTIMAISVIGGLSAISLNAVAESADMMQLAEQKQCMTCHAVDKEMPKAPSFTSIARKYPDAALEMLAGKVRNGGEGHWGAAPMPSAGARVEVTDEESRQLVAWILNMREGSKQ